MFAAPPKVLKSPAETDWLQHVKHMQFEGIDFSDAKERIAGEMLSNLISYAWSMPSLDAWQ